MTLQEQLDDFLKRFNELIPKMTHLRLKYELAKKGLGQIALQSNTAGDIARKTLKEIEES